MIRLVCNRLAWLRLGKRVLVLTALLGAACTGQGTTGQKSETTSQDDHGTKGTTQMATTEQRWKVYDGPHPTWVQKPRPREDRIMVTRAQIRETLSPEFESSVITFGYVLSRGRS